MSEIDEIQLEKINERIENLYNSKKLRKPIILIFDSPLSCKLAHRLLLLILSKKFNLAELHINFQIPIPDTLNKKIFLRYDIPIKQRLKYQKEDSKTYEYVRQQLWNILEIKKDSDLYSEETKNLQKYKLWLELINSKVNYFEFDSEKYWKFDDDLYSDGIFYGIFLQPISILCRRPKYILTDNRGNLHSEDGKAIEFVDGFGIYSVRGVVFDTGLYKKIYIDRDITPDGIIGIKNVEHRALAIQFYGYERLIKELRAVRLDDWSGISPITNMPVFCELFEFSIARRRFRFVKVEDYSTHKITSLGVPAIEQTETVMGAIAWTYGLTEEEYHPKIRT